VNKKMTSLFSRIGKEEQTCSITLVVETVEALVAEQIEMTIFFERGPQKDESNRFQMSPKVKKTTLN